MMIWKENPLNGGFKLNDLNGGSKPPFSDSGIFLKKNPESENGVLRRVWNPNSSDLFSYYDLQMLGSKGRWWCRILGRSRSRSRSFGFTGSTGRSSGRGHILITQAICTGFGPESDQTGPLPCRDFCHKLLGFLGLQQCPWMDKDRERATREAYIPKFGRKWDHLQITSLDSWTASSAFG